MLEIYMTFVRKINKIPAFYTTFARKFPNFTSRFPKNIFPGFFEGEGRAIPCPRYSCPRPHQLNPAVKFGLKFPTVLEKNVRKKSGGIFWAHIVYVSNNL